MKIELLQGGRALRQYNHENRFYVEAPPEGAYEIRLTNNFGRRRMAVISVDGVNIVDGTDASVDGPGYVLRAWETITIPGWRRNESKVAKFTFQPQEASLANRTGKGTKNTGIIGVAIFDEKNVPLFVPTPIHIHHHLQYPLGCRGLTFNTTDGTGLDPSAGETTYTCSGAGATVMDCAEVYSANTCSIEPMSAPVAESAGQILGRKKRKPQKRSRRVKSAEPQELGTGYGKETTMFTTTTEFERATKSPNLVIQIQYAVREMLERWGIPVHQEPPKPEAFPASPSPSVAPPPGWAPR